jgi:hypothetical protein
MIGRQSFRATVKIVQALCGAAKAPCGSSKVP